MLTSAILEVCAVWIDDERAVVATWDGSPDLRHLASEVPPRHRSTGHLRHDPRTRHGGGGVPDDSIARDRAGHLRDFLDEVALAVPTTGDVEILGPGLVRDQLARCLARADHHRGRARVIRTTAAGPMTDRQLIAWLRGRTGDPPRRRGIEHEA
jgi:hypothetical protein